MSTSQQASTSRIASPELSTDFSPEFTKRMNEPIVPNKDTKPGSPLFRIKDLLDAGSDGQGTITIQSLMTLLHILATAFTPDSDDSEKAANLKNILTERKAAQPARQETGYDSDVIPATIPTTKPATTKKRKPAAEDTTFKTITTRRTRNTAKKAADAAAATTPALQVTSDQTPSSAHPIRVSAAPPAEATKKSAKTPPIILHRKKDFLILEKDLKLAGFSGFSATDQKDSLRINTENSDTYRKAIDLLDRRSLPFHCFTLREDKTYRIVLKGIPEDMEEAEVEDMLQAEGHLIIRAQRMRKGQNRTPMNLMLLDIEHTEEGRKTFKIERLGNYMVSAESLRRKTEMGQCHNCQQYGHSQTGCHAPPKCVKCGKDHRTETCSKQRADGPATCANCEGQHPANYRGCPRHTRAGQPIKRAANWPALPRSTGRKYEDPAHNRQQENVTHQRPNTTWAARVADSTQLRPAYNKNVSTHKFIPSNPREAACVRAMDELVRELRDSITRSQATISRVCDFYNQTTSLTNHGQH